MDAPTSPPLSSFDRGAPRTVLAVFAHPDDESLMCGGTIARLSDAGVRMILMCASRGERGSVSDPALVPDGDDLGRVRSGELAEAAAILGIAEVITLDHADGDLRWRDVPQFHAEIVDAIVRYQPEAVLTFAENGLYWHLDHIGVHERTLTAVKSFGAEAPPLYYVTMPKGIIRDVVDAVHAKSGEAVDTSFWGIEPDAFGEAEMPPSLAIDVRPWVPRKLAALRCHRTQMGTHNPIAWIDEDEARRWLGVEFFRRSPLPCAVRDPVLEQLGAPVAT
jgi:N-acetyl-1-D-myo-inositol-2-amino-2-deoxy-alpha-D-glucopyranoside deacetylase